MMYRNEAIISTLCMQFNKPDSDMMIFLRKVFQIRDLKY